MGAVFSELSSPSPSIPSQPQKPKSAAAMAEASSDKHIDTENPDEKPIVTENPDQKPIDTQNPGQESENKEGEEGEEEEEGECGFCLFMKGGECRETFINWEKCVEEGEKNDEDIVEKCFEVTSALKKCMEANQDYYGIILQAEKDAEQQVKNQLDQEKQEEKDVAEEVNSGEQQLKPEPKQEQES